MRLKRIEVQNFRQFYGKQSIDFSTGEKNTTVVLGINNAGKTGIYRALMFGLYGEVKLAQDSKGTDIHLVNFKALNQEDFVEAKVKVIMEHLGEEYSVSRSVTGIKTKNNIEERLGEASLDFKDKSGEYHEAYRKGSQVKDLINNILDENIKEFFLFDGEKIETLARADKNSRKEVKNGIIKLMEIDKLNKVRDTIEKIYRDEEKRISKKYENNQIRLLQNMIDRNREQVNNNKNIMDELEDNLASIKEEQVFLEEKLKANKEIKELLSEKHKFTLNRKSLLNDLEKNKENLSRYLFKDASFSIMSDYIKASNKKIQANLLRQDDLISIHIINKSLEGARCLCCNQSISDEETIAYIKEIKDNYKSSRLTGLMEELYRVGTSKIKGYDKFLENLSKELEDISQVESSLSKVSSSLEDIDIKIKGQDNLEENLRAQQKRYDNLNRQEGSVKEKLSDLEKGQERVLKELAELERKLDKELKFINNKDYEIKRCDFLRDLSKKLDEKYIDYVDRTKKLLSEKTTETFKTLIDSKKKSLVDKIVIGDNYELKIYNKNNIEVTQDISQGQQMVVALAFITSLASMASKSELKIDYPLFMDTPFGRLSKQNRENLIKNLPRLTNQWIPLFTDTDYTDYEKKIFDEENIVGKAHTIDKIDENHSVIRPTQI